MSRDVGGWTGRLDVRGMDHVGFVRMRKAGTTSVHHHLEKVLQLCVPRCLDRRTLCHNCLYGAPDCTCKASSPQRRYTFERCYPCNHMSPWTIQENFRNFVAKSLSGTSARRVYKRVLLYNRAALSRRFGGGRRRWLCR